MRKIHITKAANPKNDASEIIDCFGLKEDALDKVFREHEKEKCLDSIQKLYKEKREDAPETTFFTEEGKIIDYF